MLILIVEQDRLRGGAQAVSKSSAMTIGRAATEHVLVPAGSFGNVRRAARPVVP